MGVPLFPIKIQDLVRIQLLFLHRHQQLIRINFFFHPGYTIQSPIRDFVRHNRQTIFCHCPVSRSGSICFISRSGGIRPIRFSRRSCPVNRIRRNYNCPLNRSPVISRLCGRISCLLPIGGLPCGRIPRLLPIGGLPCGRIPRLLPIGGLPCGRIPRLLSVRSLPIAGRLLPIRCAKVFLFRSDKLIPACHTGFPSKFRIFSARFRLRRTFAAFLIRGMSLCAALLRSGLLHIAHRPQERIRRIDADRYNQYKRQKKRDPFFVPENFFHFSTSFIRVKPSLHPIPKTFLSTVLPAAIMTRHVLA